MTINILSENIIAIDLWFCLSFPFLKIFGRMFFLHFSLRVLSFYCLKDRSNNPYSPYSLLPKPCTHVETRDRIYAYWWWGWVGWGGVVVITFMSTWKYVMRRCGYLLLHLHTHTRHATLFYLLLHLHTYIMLRCAIFSLLKPLRKAFQLLMLSYVLLRKCPPNVFFVYALRAASSLLPFLVVFLPGFARALSPWRHCSSAFSFLISLVAWVLQLSSRCPGRPHPKHLRTIAKWKQPMERKLDFSTKPLLNSIQMFHCHVPNDIAHVTCDEIINPWLQNLFRKACFIHLERLKPMFPFKHMLSCITKNIKLHVTDCSKNKP